MTQPSPNQPEELSGAEQRFATLVASLAGRPRVTSPGEGGGRGFGSSALKVHGSIFAMLSRGRLVVKLPRERVSSVQDSGIGGPFDAGKGTPMKEWVTVLTDDGETWHTLAQEAFDFVSRRTRRD